MQDFEHQRKIIADNPDKTGLFLGTGGGKTRIALSLARGKTLVIAPKKQVEDKNWQTEVKKMKLKIDLTVISKEKFRKLWRELPRFNTVIGEEGHTLCGASPSIVWIKRQKRPKTSQLFDGLLEYLQTKPPERFYLVTATPTRSPMAVWAAARLFGYEWDFFKFREKFYIPLPMPGRDVWATKKDAKTKAELAALVKKLGYVGRLEDWFDVPEQTFKTEYFTLNAEQKKKIKELDKEFPDPLVRFGKIHQVENGFLLGNEYVKTQRFGCEKYDKLIDLAEEFPQLLIFAKYTEQINMIQEILEKAGKKVLVLNGSTKDSGKLIAEANSSEECVVVAQHQISSGYELPNYPCVVYVSLSGSLVDLIQSYGRVQRVNNLKKNLYIFLVMKGGNDEVRYKTNMNHQDFHEQIYLREQKMVE